MHEELKNHFTQLTKDNFLGYANTLLDSPKTSRRLSEKYGLPVYRFHLQFKTNGEMSIKVNDENYCNSFERHAEIRRFPSFWIESGKGGFFPYDHYKLDMAMPSFRNKLSKIFSNLAYYLDNETINIDLNEVLKNDTFEIPYQKNRILIASTCYQTIKEKIFK